MVVVEVRLKLETLAQLVQHYTNTRRLVRSRSHLVRAALEDYTKVLNLPDISAVEAIAILGDLGLSSNKRFKQGVIKAVQLDQAEETLVRMGSDVSGSEVGYEPGSLIETLRPKEEGGVKPQCVGSG